MPAQRARGAVLGGRRGTAAPLAERPSTEDAGAEDDGRPAAERGRTDGGGAGGAGARPSAGDASGHDSVGAPPPPAGHGGPGEGRSDSVARLQPSTCAVEQLDAQPPLAEGTEVPTSNDSADAPPKPRTLTPKVGLQRQVLQRPRTRSRPPTHSCGGEPKRRTRCRARRARADSASGRGARCDHRRPSCRRPAGGRRRPERPCRPPAERGPAPRGAGSSCRAGGCSRAEDWNVRSGGRAGCRVRCRTGGRSPAPGTLNYNRDLYQHD